MEIKTIDVGGKLYAELQDGKPVYVHPDGKEAAFDVPDMYVRLLRDGKSVNDLRKRAEDAEVKLKDFDDLDLDQARKAIETTKNLDEGKLLTAGKVEEIKAAAKRAAEEQVANAAKASGEQLKTLQAERDKLRDEFYGEKIGGAFSRSKFIAEKAAIPADLMQARFGSAFKVEDGKTVAYDASGNKIYSRTKPGEIADFEEALETIVDHYQHRDQILKGTGSTGSGARPGNGSGAPGAAKTMPRSEFDRLNPLQQRQAAVVDRVQIVD